MDNFDFNIKKLGVPIIGITANRISFNEDCISILGYPEFVCIVLDREAKKLAVKVYGKDSKTYPRYRFVASEKDKKRIYLNSVYLCQEIIRLIGKNISKQGFKFIAVFDQENKMLVVDLKKCI